MVARLLKRGGGLVRQLIRGAQPHRPEGGAAATRAGAPGPASGASTPRGEGEDAPGALFGRVLAEHRARGGGVVYIATTTSTGPTAFDPGPPDPIAKPPGRRDPAA